MFLRWINPRIRNMKQFVRRSLRRVGYSLDRISDEEIQRIKTSKLALSRLKLTDIFGIDLPKLQELRKRYATVNLPIAQHSLWGATQESDVDLTIGWGQIDLRTFRGDSAYVWAYADTDVRLSKAKYFIFADAVRRKDSMQLLQTLSEDGAFGCITFEYPGIKPVSRDLLDSVLELNFLHKHLQVLSRDDLRVLDIGAGYGRMAHRMLTANPHTKSYACVDAVPESTFLCGFYLKHRGLQSHAQVIAMDELEQRLLPNGYDLALNIHSFSECTYGAIKWWLGQIARMQVRYLMIIPNEPTSFLSMETDRSRRDYAPLLRELGYELIAQEPVFDDPAVQEIIGVKDNMFLFERRERVS